MRWALPGRGKSGGSRVIYYFHNESMPVFLLSVDAKNKQVNLSPTERSALKRLVPELIKAYRGRRIQ